MSRWKLTLQYDGQAFHGWQSQARLPTVQDTLERALAKLCQTSVRCHVAGRTDRGVHALAQVVHVDLPRRLPPKQMRRAIQAHLQGAALAVVDAEPVPETFHARFSAKMRHYHYRILQTPYPPILQRGRVWWQPRYLDHARMQLGATLLLGTHDFSSFRAAGCQASEPVRTLSRASICSEAYLEGQAITVEFSARSFLYHQVRNMVGTLVEVGLGRRAPDEVVEILAARDRTKAGITAPPEGLYFVGVEYGDSFDDSNRDA